MAGGIKYTVKADLINAVISRIFTNTSFEISALDVQASMCDMIESLWDDLSGDNLIETDYTTLANEQSSGDLIPGAWYRFEYENVHLVPGTTIANTEIPGYVSYAETFVILATATDKLNGFVLSETNPYDVIRYDVIQTAVGTSNVPTNGTIKRRKSVDKNIDAPFDFRNHWVARDDANWASFVQSGTITANRADFVADGFSGNANQIYANFFDGTSAATSPSVLTGRLFNGSDFDGYFSTGYTYSMPNNASLPMASNITYDLALNVNTCSNVMVDQNTTDVKIFSSSNIFIKGICSAITVGNSKDIRIDTQSQGVGISSCDGIEIGREATSLMLYASYNMKIGRRVIDVWASFVHDSDIKGNLSNSIIYDLMDSFIGSKNNSLITNNLKASIIASRTSFVTAGFGIGIKILDASANVVSLGGDYNTFEEDCNTINIDNRNGAGGVFTYLTYSSISHSTFKKGCRNIIFQASEFNPMLVTRCTFGENCENLTFDQSVSDTTFQRGTRNKDFTGLSLSKATFMNPSELPWTYDAGTPEQTILGFGFTISSTPETVTTSTLNKEPVGSNPDLTYSNQAWTRCIMWRYDGRPTLIFSH